MTQNLKHGVWINWLHLIKQMSFIVKIILSLIVTIICLGIVVFFAGGGHGTFIPMKLLFPYSMIIGIANENINWVAIVISIIQFPIYIFTLHKKSKWKLIVPILHILAIIIVFNLSDQIFN